MANLPAQAISADPNAPWRRLRPAWLYQSILKGKFEDDEETWNATVESVGSIVFPSGRLVACDPITIKKDQQAFVQVLPAGSHTVVSATAWVSESHGRFAALLVVTSNSPVVAWELALLDGQDVAHLDPDDVYGYATATASGGLFDAEVIPDLCVVADIETPEDDGPLIQALEASDPTIFSLSPGGVAMCTSGWGDGIYPTWLGYSTSGDVVVAMTDFLVMEGPAFPAPDET